jgi:hypothetical protein
MKHKSIALVVPHTHWDRAWYWPAERFRGRLCEMFDLLIQICRKQPEFRFTLDGQCIPLLDYLEVRPEDERFLRRMARQGRLKLGPMYCLSDVYCTGGEALIRNLQLGMDCARRFGGLQTVWHMPDQFGVTPCVPMIARGFGLRAVTFMRGVSDALPKQTRMFLWEAADGSAVRVMRLRDGYGNASWIGMTPQPGQRGPFDLDGDVERLIQAARRQTEGGQGEPLLLLAGSDHQLPGSRLRLVMREAARRSEFRFRFSDLDEMADQMARKDSRQWPRYTGEFHGTGAASVLGGTVSARIYLKQRNAAVEQFLVHQVEPLAALAGILSLPDSGAACLRQAWKHLLKTHPHDDICGCSVDAVHREDEHQMVLAWQAGDVVRRRVMLRLLQHFGANAPGDMRPSFALFNAQAVTRRGPVELVYDFEGQRKWDDIALPKAYRVVDEEGTPVPFCELERGQSAEHPHEFARLQLHPKLPPCGFKRFYIEPTPAWPRTSPRRQATLENDRLRVAVRPNGAFDLADKLTGRRHSGLGLFSDQTDIGDTYDFADVPGELETVFTAARGRLEAGNGCGGLQTLRWRGHRRLPFPVEVIWALAPKSDALEVRLRFTNTVRDHRLRWNLSLRGRIPTTLAGLPFGTIQRPAGRAPRRFTPPRIHPEHPAESFVAAGGLAVFSRFPFNYEVVAGRPSRLAITILRSVGFLCNPNGLTTRPDCAGPYTATPEAQCLGRTFEMVFAVRPYAAREKARLFQEALLWRAQPAFGQMDPTLPYVERTDQPEPEPIFALDGEAIVSAFKPKSSGDGAVLRLFNPFTTAKTLTLRLARPLKVFETNLEEKRTGQCRSLKLRLAPHELRTFELLRR